MGHLHSPLLCIYISCQMNDSKAKHSNFHHGIRATLNPSFHTQPSPPTKGIFLLCTQPLKVSSLSIDYIPLHHLAHHTSHISNLQLLFWCLFLSAFPLFVWLVSWEWWPCVNLCSGSVLHLYWLVFCISFPPASWSAFVACHDQSLEVTCFSIKKNKYIYIYIYFLSSPQSSILQ